MRGCLSFSPTQFTPSDWIPGCWSWTRARKETPQNWESCIRPLTHNMHFEIALAQGLRVRVKAEEPEIKLPTSSRSSKKQDNSRKTSISALLTMPKPLTVWITINCGKFFKRWEYQTTWPASWEICMQVRKQQLELDMEQQTGSKSEKEYIKAVYCHPAYLTYM